MAHQFAQTIVDAVLSHMNDDHLDDNLLIVRAFGAPDATAATMTSFDGAGGRWSVHGGEKDGETLDVAWPAGAITERAEVRREVVALYDAACAELGVTPRPH